MEMLPPEAAPAGPGPPAPGDPETGSSQGGSNGSKTDVIGIAERYVVLLAKIFYRIAGAGLVAMLALVVADIIGIKIFSSPVPGGIEIVTFLAVVAIGFAIAFTQVMHGHVAVDFVVGKLPPRAKAVLESITVLFSVALMVLLTYYSFKYAAKLRETGEVSMTQKIPFYPFVYGLAVCWVVTTLVLLVQFAKAIRKVVRAWTPSP